MEIVIQKRIILVLIVIAAIFITLFSVLSVRMNISEKKNIAFYKNLDPASINYVRITETVRVHKKDTIHLLKEFSQNEETRQFGTILYSFDKLRSGEKPIALRRFIFEIRLKTGEAKNLLVWIQKRPKDKAFIEFIERFEYLGGIITGTIDLGKAESKMLRKWLDEQIILPDGK